MASGETLVTEFELERVRFEFCCAMRIFLLFEYHFSEPLGCPLSQYRSALQGRAAFIYPCKSGCGERRLTACEPVNDASERKSAHKKTSLTRTYSKAGRATRRHDEAQLRSSVGVQDCSDILLDRVCREAHSGAARSDTPG